MPKTPEHPTILIVDDDGDMRQMVALLLDMNGYRQHIEARDGLHALEVLAEHQVDLVICDWVMPRMNGLELLRALRKKREYKKLPFLMLTAEGMSFHLKEAIRAGAQDFIIKPFEPDTLITRVASLLPLS